VRRVIFLISIMRGGIMQKHVRSGYLGLVFGLLATALVACGGGGPGSDGEESEEPAQAMEAPVAESAEETEEVGTASLTLINNSGLLVCAFFMIPNGSTDWGMNRLPERLPSGQEITISGIPADTYDVKLHDCDGNIITWLVDIELPSNAVGSIQVNPPSNFVIIANNSGQPICAVYAVPPNRGPYRRNLLAADQSIPPGMELTLSFDPGPWNISAASCDGAVIEQADFVVEGQVSFPVGD
jgi:hypothetical protein